MSRFYDRRSWRRTSAAYLHAHPFCVLCTAQGRTTAATQVDHIIPLPRNPAPYDWSGLQPLCDVCHSEKTRIIEAGKHLHGCAVDGTPISPLHPWRQEG